VFIAFQGNQACDINDRIPLPGWRRRGVKVPNVAGILCQKIIGHRAAPSRRARLLVSGEGRSNFYWKKSVRAFVGNLAMTCAEWTGIYFNPRWNFPLLPIFPGWWHNTHPILAP
jgi:hypothetical protein